MILNINKVSLSSCFICAIVAGIVLINVLMAAIIVIADVFLVMVDAINVLMAAINVLENVI